MLDSIRHLLTAEENDRPIAEGQDGEQHTNDGEDNASAADSIISQESKSRTPSDPASSSRAVTLLANSTPKTTTPNPPILTSSELEGIDTVSRNLIDGFFTPTRSMHIHIQLTDFPCEMIENVPIIVGSLLPAALRTY